jgi:16S rRNA (guanine966-N2)-methyltransferase
VAKADRKRARRVSIRRATEPKPASARSQTSYPRKLRIIGGRWRGRILDVSESEGLRPTPDRVRETLFNWLAPYIAGATCLDLFAGTGALCLEALSRGAARVVMVEKAPHVAERLRQHVKRLDALGAEVVLADAVEFLEHTPQAFDIVFIDPPFRSDLISHSAAAVDTGGWIRPGGLAYIEAPSRLGELSLPATWEVIRSKKSGQVGYHLARKTV